MSRHLNVLIIEDSEDDTLLTLRELRRGGYSLDYVRVDTPTAMQAALEERTWDIAIADFSMPAFSGLEALKLLQRYNLDLPFIVVSGTIGEDVAVAVMKAGAHDYLLKSNLTRLVPAVEREVREARERRKRHSTEQALQESEERFQTLCNSAPLAIFQTDCQGRRTYNNPLWHDISGLSEERSLGYGWADAIHPEERLGVLKSWEHTASKQGSWVHEHRLLTQQGEIRWVRALASPMYSTEGNFLGHVGTVEDITKQKQAAQRIYEQAALLDISTDAISVCDLENQILFWNKGAERLYKWKSQEAIGKNAEQILYNSEESLILRRKIQAILAKDGKWQGELEQVSKGGKKIVVESRWTLIYDEVNKPKSILIVSTDITEKKQLQAQFLRAQRLESLGALAGGIAHDFNNILTPILAVAQLLSFKFPNLDDNNKQLLAILEGSAKRGADLVKQILSFTRGVEGTRTTIQLRHLLVDVAQVAKKTFPKFIDTQVNIAPDLWTVFGDPTQLHQVLMNLVVNARDAMPDGGTLSISAENFWVEEEYARMHVDASVGSYAAIAISDTGMGIYPEILDRIFDPFFTTKEQGKGTGLGLSTAMSIIRSHGGFVTVYSEVGKGSNFNVYLPSSQIIETDTPADVELPEGNGELILVVDDEATICEITKNTLNSHNYKVLTASDGIGALALYAQHKESIGLVLIDMMMPGIDGPSTILKLQRINPKVKIVAMSGLVAHSSTIQYQNLQIQGFLSKPFTTEILLNTISSALK
ncbi:hybrid sensor histidine kinase/response regulator [Mastigocoleus testarum]|uniref:histidine kinase n=1 Tax=Mastigocoleus testarum BC008 TaxID=371196 RepID=A0A0V7ZXZ8_9CYAN|nr:PAS domain S-box protein [Mastigocoleus testarum]KST69278.1 hypothetical protein BC008_03575 [Mastigocoleus testarum BC008]